MDLEITKKHERFIQAAASQAILSPCAQKHGCVIAGNGKIFGKGFNSYRTQSKDNLLKGCTSCHAEIAAIRNALYHKNHLKVAEEHIICC